MSKSIGKILIGCVVLLMKSVFEAIISGYTLSVLWGWFMVIRLGLPPLNAYQSIGILVVVSFMMYQGNGSGIEKNDDETFWDSIFKASGVAVLKCGVFLCLGWIIHKLL
jgi:hypothetical protein